MLERAWTPEMVIVKTENAYIVGYYARPKSSHTARNRLLKFTLADIKSRDASREIIVGADWNNRDISAEDLGKKFGFPPATTINFAQGHSGTCFNVAKKKWSTLDRFISTATHGECWALPNYSDSDHVPIVCDFMIQKSTPLPKDKKLTYVNKGNE